MDTNLAIGPVIHGIPTQPVSVFQSAEDAFDLLLTGVAGHDLFRTPVHAISQQHGPPQALSQELREGGGIKVKLQMPATVVLFQLIANELGQEGGGQPAPNLALG